VDYFILEIRTVGPKFRPNLCLHNVVTEKDKAKLIEILLKRNGLDIAMTKNLIT